MYLKKFTRIYIGNEFCPLNFPDLNTLDTILNSALKEIFDITISFPFVREKNLNKYEKILDFLKEWCANNNKQIEIIVNDWGTLNLITCKYKEFTPVLGRLLNKIKKDPRLIGKLGIHDLREVYIENNLNFEEFSDYLNNLGVYRYVETSLQKNKIKNKYFEGKCNNFCYYPWV